MDSMYDVCLSAETGMRDLAPCDRFILEQVGDFTPTQRITAAQLPSHMTKFHAHRTNLMSVTLHQKARAQFQN